MKFSILSVGDEICIGQIVNTNAAWIAAKMTETGYSAVVHSSVPDEALIMKSELKRLIDISDVVIITGGLGPTHDDITKGVLVDFFDDKLVTDEKTALSLEKRFERLNRKISDINKAQSLVPSKCKPLENKAGTAPGILFEIGDKLIVSLPGVPAEMKYIMEFEFLPIATEHFKKYTKEVQLFLTIKTSGIFESDLYELIGSPDKFPGNTSLAYLPSAGSVRLRIGAKGETAEIAQNVLKEMKYYIIEKADKYIIGYGNDSLQSLVGNLLKINNLTVSVAESCTGGMLGGAFTDISGSSAYFKGGFIVYSNELKHSLLNIKNETLDEFGAVSEQIALEMAKNVRKICNSDIGISITGVAGPDGGTDEKPVGTVWIGFSNQKETFARLYLFGNDRTLNRERTVMTALELIRKRVNEL